jgi:hypothetical protein
VTYLDHGGVEVALFIYEKDVERLVSVADAMPAIAEVFRLSGADETKKRKKNDLDIVREVFNVSKEVPIERAYDSALPRGRTAN